VIKKNRLFLIMLAFIFIIGSISCSHFGSPENGPWYLNIQKWAPKQKADFFMGTWMAEKENYDILNAIENKPEDLIKVLKVKYQILENSRIPVKVYADIVNAGDIPNQTDEQEIINWLRSLQVQLVYGG